MIYFYYFQTLLNNMHTVILSNFRKTRTKDRIESYCIVSYRIVSNRIVSYRIFFKNAEKETSNQTIELLSYKNKNFRIKTNFFKQILQSSIFFIFILKKVSSYSTRLLRVLLGYYTTRPF
jgi:hypothetical protein